MSKSILVIETPYECYDCPCYYEDKDKCEAIMRNAYANLCGRPSWCPLKPLNENAVKIGNKDFVIYQRQYLYDNLDREIELLKSAKEFEEKQNESRS